jgi:hypothetical protein
MTVPPTWVAGWARRAADPGNGVQTLQGVSERVEQVLDPGFDRGDVAVQGIDPGQHRGQQKGVVVLNRPTNASAAAPRAVIEDVDLKEGYSAPIW